MLARHGCAAIDHRAKRLAPCRSGWRFAASQSLRRRPLPSLENDSDKIEKRRQDDREKWRSEEIELAESHVSQQQCETSTEQKPRIKQDVAAKDGEVPVHRTKQYQAETVARVDADPHPPDRRL